MERLVNSKFFPADINYSQIAPTYMTQLKLIQDKSYCGKRRGRGTRNIPTEMRGLFYLRS